MSEWVSECVLIRWFIHFSTAHRSVFARKNKGHKRVAHTCAEMGCPRAKATNEWKKFIQSVLPFSIFWYIDIVQICFRPLLHALHIACEIVYQVFTVNKLCQVVCTHQLSSVAIRLRVFVLLPNTWTARSLASARISFVQMHHHTISEVPTTDFRSSSFFILMTSVWHLKAYLQLKP